jgi:multidrug efflux system membrane fusion protein
VAGLKNGAATAAAGVSRAQAQLSASAAEVVRLEAQLRHADDHFKRLEPLLPQQFVTVDRLEEARTQRDTAAAALASTRAQRDATEAAVRQARTERARAADAVGETDGINARLAAAQAAVHAAELDLGYCQVAAPFAGKVVNLNISEGAFARAGADVFAMVDTRTWYVVANFRETQLQHISAGAAADLYLQSQPGKHFRGTVVGLGWAVLPENGTSVNGLPRVERSLDWIRLAARFPVRIQVDDPDDSFRLGASAVATVRGVLRADSR